MDFTKHNTLIAEILLKLEVFQDEFIKTHNVCWQGLSTHSSIPTKDTTANKLDVRPSTKPQEPTWADTLIVDAGLPFSMEVHEWVGSGRGWTVIFTTSDGIDKYARRVEYVIQFELDGGTAKDEDGNDYPTGNHKSTKVDDVAWAKLASNGVN